MLENILINKETDKLKIFSYGEITPEVIMYPRTIKEISQIMNFAAKNHKKVMIHGNGSQKYLGGFPQPFDIAISLSRLNNIVEYDINNLTITVEAGLKLKELHHTVHKNNHFLPLDPPGRENSTIGGIVATNASGPRRYLYGCCPDLILGMHFILPDSSYAKTGGKTMKNVAGYDLAKLFVGSMGTLAAVVNITVRLYPLPAESKTVEIEFNELETCKKFIDKILASKLVFSSIDLLNSEAINNLKHSLVSYGLYVRFEGDRKICKYGVDRLTEMANTSDALRVGLVSKNFWQNYQRMPIFTASPENEITVKISLPISNIARAISFLEGFGSNNKIPVTIVCHAGNGVIYVSFPLEKSINSINEIRLYIAKLEGHLVIQKIPFKFKKGIDVWGESKSTSLIFQQIKNQFDPQQTLAKGRFIGGL